MKGLKSMRLSWRREDSGYLAAAIGAGAVVVYLVFGNFGLVPSPFAGPQSRALTAGIDPVLLATPGVEVEVDPVAAPRPQAGPPGDAPADADPPIITVATESGTTFTVDEPAFVEGFVRDAGSGVDRVVVVFVPTDGDTKAVRAVVACDDRARRQCYWRAEVPATAAAEYTVTAEATDRAGNDAEANPIDVTVVNAGGPVTEVTDAVQRVPSLLEKLAGRVLGILGGD